MVDNFHFFFFFFFFFFFLVCRFVLDPVSGIVTTKARLDRETKSLYTLILVARDQGSPSQQATRILEVVVKDIDDHPPQFIRTPVTIRRSRFSSGFHFSADALRLTCDWFSTTDLYSSASWKKWERPGRWTL